eukprot:325587-Pyramimonas_sp.AAC.1
MRIYPYFLRLIGRALPSSHPSVRDANRIGIVVKIVELFAGRGPQAFKRAAFKLSEETCTSEWLANLRAGQTDQWSRTRREVVDDTTVLVLFFR